MDLRFAFAVNDKNLVQKKHFGDSDKILIYELRDDKIMLISENPNPFKLMDEEVEHGSKKKGKAIIDFLVKENVNILVSQQFGKNIKLINEHFIPVIVYTENPDDVIQVLSSHIHWIIDEWQHNESNYKLFTIKSGILKSAIKK